MQVMSVTVILDAFWNLPDFGTRMKQTLSSKICPLVAQRHKDIKMFGTNNTLWGIVNHKVAIILFGKTILIPNYVISIFGITAYMNPPVAYKYGPYADLEAVYGVWRFYRNSYFIPPIKIRSYGLFTPKLP